MKIGVQTYSLLRYSEREGVDKTFKIITDAGFETVEPIYHDYGLGLRKVGEIMRSYGLTAPSSHVSADLLSNRVELEKMLEAFNFKHAVISHIAPEIFYDEERLSETMLKALENAEKYSLTLSYHNHDFEFKGDDNLSLLPAKYPPLMLEPDVFWLKAAGYEPIDFLQKNAEYVSFVHLKEFGRDKTECSPIVGEGTVGAKEIINFAKREKHETLVVEYEKIGIADEEYLKKSYKFIAETLNGK